MANLQIRQMSKADWPNVAAIYQEGIETWQATFESQAPATWDLWIAGKIESCLLVVQHDEEIVGWAALSRVSNRMAYIGVAEVSVYVRTQFHGIGIGSRLMDALITCSEQNNIWTLQASIFPENQASLQLHLRHGFRVVGYREKISRVVKGPFQGKWRDTLLLERRSTLVGIS